MKQVDILTSNNVTIQYELASVGQRFIALLLDLIIITIYSFIISLIITSILTSTIRGGDWQDLERSAENIQIVQYTLLLPVIMFYNLVSEIFFNGQTIGKKVMMIRVVKVSGEPPSLGDYFIRWTYRLVDIILSAGAIAAIFVSSSEKSQRLGDMAANTTIIRLNPSTKYSVRDILKISKTSNYDPIYTQVTQLSDEDMLLIKNAIDRVKKFPNEANKKFVLALVQKVAEKLNISEVPQNKIKFLRTLLKDYIVLTR